MEKSLESVSKDARWILFSIFLLSFCFEFHKNLTKSGLEYASLPMLDVVKEKVEGDFFEKFKSS